MMPQLSELLTQVCELEGLLLVADKHGDETPQVVFDRIAELAELIADAAQRPLRPVPRVTGSQEPDAPAESEPAAEPERAAKLERIVEPTVPEPEPAEAHEPTSAGTPALPEQDYDADETWQHDNGEEFTEVFKVDYVEPDSRSADESADAALRVDEKLQRSLSKDMRKALSLNDRFRFKRELFSNSDVELNNALDMVSAMRDFDEAADYFLGDLGWDQDNEDVADFMGLVRRHFL